MYESKEHYVRDCDLKEEILEFGKKLRVKYIEPKFKTSSKLRELHKLNLKDKI
jgi:hypothetical protein